MKERVLFIGTQFSILYTSMYSPAEAATRIEYQYQQRTHSLDMNIEIRRRPRRLKLAQKVHDSRTTGRPPHGI